LAVEFGKVIFVGWPGIDLTFEKVLSELFHPYKMAGKEPAGVNWEI